MIDNEDLLIEICGSRKVAAFKEVKLTSMRVARATREVIASDLRGTLPARGKQFLTTSKGLYRLASRSNSDNTTEQEAIRRLGATVVQVFGELSADRRARGWITVEDLYRAHRVRFDADTIVKKVARRVELQS